MRRRRPVVAGYVYRKGKRIALTAEQEAYRQVVHAQARIEGDRAFTETMLLSDNNSALAGVARTERYKAVVKAVDWTTWMNEVNPIRRADENERDR